MLNGVLLFSVADAEPKVPEPEDLRTKSPELHWICWPEPKSFARRPHTSLGLHRKQTTLKQTFSNPGNEHVRYRWRPSDSCLILLNCCPHQTQVLIVNYTSYTNLKCYKCVFCIFATLSVREWPPLYSKMPLTCCFLGFQRQYYMFMSTESHICPWHSPGR